MDSVSAPSKSGPDLGKPQFASHEWLEPIIVVGIMIGSLILNRDRGFSIFDRRKRSHSKPLLEPSNEYDRFLDDNSSEESLVNTVPRDREPKKRHCFGKTIETPNTSRFANHWHSRFLQKFPFLIEMFYWIINFGAYSITKEIPEAYYAGKGNAVVKLAQSHGIGILWFEHESIVRFFFPIREVDVQGFFLAGHTSAMTFLNRAYSLVHIPAVITFLSWYYFAAPDHHTFAIVRRTMTLGNFAAFVIFSFWPCMPPRLLPESFGFHDTVRQDHAESVWVGGKTVNQLAAMPSLHFTYAFITGATIVYHSGFLRRFSSSVSKRRMEGQALWKELLLVFAGIFYPALVLLVIVATANHYYLDAVVATLTVTLSLLFNRVWNILLPLEDCLAWVLRVEKPIPTTGMRWSKERH